ncbi:glutathione S-transferase 2 [[Candida] railenensis]|uniref:Glutathione S-transferase 2 n=1 Tax=[Candida] railenensis TaxID=45579 RepID=A0A9P0QU86_9ASCO|nr:glutathione S-transferase 2 [[Candida] railenensis]
MGQMKIYDFPGGPYVTRVRMALAENNLQSLVEYVLVDLTKGEHKKPDLLAKNYSGTLPVLEIEPGLFLSECTAITEYLDNLDGKPKLTGVTPKEKGIIHMMNHRAEIELLDPFSVYFHNSTPGLGPEVEIYQNNEWGLHQRAKSVKGMHYFDSVLRKQPFIAGNTFSMADITVVGGLIFGAMLKVPIPEECDALIEWYARMQTRSSFINRVTMSNS